MRHNEDEHAIELFLYLTRSLLDENRIVIASRLKNLQARIDHRLRFAEQVAMMHSLSCQHYSHSLPSEAGDESLAHVFGVQREESVFYIKLKIKPYPSSEGVLHCVSFHLTEEEMDFPYRS